MFAVEGCDVTLFITFFSVGGNWELLASFETKNLLHSPC